MKHDEALGLQPESLEWESYPGAGPRHTTVPHELSTSPIPAYLYRARPLVPHCSVRASLSLPLRPYRACPSTPFSFNSLSRYAPGSRASYHTGGLPNHSPRPRTRGALPERDSLSSPSLHDIARGSSGSSTSVNKIKSSVGDLNGSKVISSSYGRSSGQQ